MRNLVWLALLAALGSCVLPFGSASPQPATSAGKGRFTVGGRAELPTVDLLETQELDGDEVEVTPFPVTSFELGYGIHDKLDLEVGLDFAILIIAPVPLGGFGGLRAQIYRNHNLAVAAAARIGYVGMSNDDDDSVEDRAVSALYGTGNLTVQGNPDGWLSPGLSLGYTGASVEDDPAGQPAVRSFASLGNATLYVDVTRGQSHVGPFANLVIIDNDASDPEIIITGGLFFYARFGQPSPPPGQPLGY